MLFRVPTETRGLASGAGLRGHSPCRGGSEGQAWARAFPEVSAGKSKAAGGNC